MAVLFDSRFSCMCVSQKQFANVTNFVCLVHSGLTITICVCVINCVNAETQAIHNNMEVIPRLHHYTGSNGY